MERVLNGHDVNLEGLEVDVPCLRRQSVGLSCAS